MTKKVVFFVRFYTNFEYTRHFQSDKTVDKMVATRKTSVKATASEITTKEQSIITKQSKASKCKKKSVNDNDKKPKRVVNRFNGMSEDEIAKRGLPDHLKQGLDIVFIGINPSMHAAYSGKYYDGPGNHFWKALYLSGFLPSPMGPEDDYKLQDLGIGFTNVVPRQVLILDMNSKVFEKFTKFQLGIV